jgi:PAS domain S-box-containing protein
VKTERANVIKAPLQILHLEDNARDAELIQEILQADGIVCHIRRVETQADFLTSLEQSRFDLILADFSLPSFDGLSALELALKKCPNIPFIFVSATLGEEVAVEALKRGATDYVLKDRLSRIVPSVQRALREAEETNQRKRAEGALRQSEEQWRDVFEHNPTMYFIVDPAGMVLSVNPFGAEQLGYWVDELVGDTVLKVFYETDREAAKRNVALCLEQPGRSMSWELRKIRKNGTMLWVRETARAVLRANGPIVLVACEDITERKRTEEELAKTEQRLRAVIANTPIILFALDRSGMFTLSEGRGLDDLGLKPAVGQSVFDTYRDAPHVISNYRRAMAGESFAALVEADGLVFETHYIPVLDEAGEVIGVNGVAINITERKRAEEALRRSEHYFAEAQRLSHTGSWAWDLASGKGHYWSEEMYRILGFNPQEVLPSRENFWQLVHPEDREGVYERIQKAIREKAEYVGDHRIVLPDGTLKYIHTRGHPVFNAAGEVTEFIGTSVDVTERRETERKLEEAQRLTHVGYWDRDLDMDLITWSDETYRIYGVPTEERVLTLYRIQELIHAEDRPMMLEAASAALRGGQRYDVEYRVIRPNGEVRIVHSQADVTRDESGRPRRVFGTVQDITERKRAERRLLVQHTVTQILAEAATIEEATPKILQAIGECLRWDVGALWRVDREAAVMRCVEVWHRESVQVPEFESVCRQTAFLPGVGMPGKVWASSKARYISDLVREANFERTPIAARERLRAAFGFPVLLGGEVLGVIEFFSHEIGEPDQDLLEMLATIGSQIGQFIERKRAEQAFLGAQAELAHVTRVATLGELTASIAHEINQPLGAIVNNASACLRWLAAENLEEARSSAALVIEDGYRTGEIIRRIRSFAKKAPPQKDWIDINQTIREVIALARSEMQRHNVELDTKLSEDMHYVPLIFADRIQLQQVILNLIMNAVESVREVSDGPRQLLIRTGIETPGEIVVAVRDSGVGLAPENLDQLFTPFYTTKPQGMGMGLAICRSIVEAHAGRLWATANHDRGATFHFTLPTGSDTTSRLA